MRLSTPSLSLLLLAALAAPSAAQMGAGAPAAGVVSDLLSDVQTARDKLVGLARAIPAEDYDWRPGEGVRSVREVFLHVAADNYFLPTAMGTMPPASTGILNDQGQPSYEGVQAYEARALSKDDVVRELEASFDHLQGVMEKEGQGALEQSVDLFGQSYTHRQVWILATTHVHEHLGQMIAYARTNGVVPPWSR